MVHAHTHTETQVSSQKGRLDRSPNPPCTVLQGSTVRLQLFCRQLQRHLLGKITLCHAPCFKPAELLAKLGWTSFLHIISIWFFRPCDFLTMVCLGKKRKSSNCLIVVVPYTISPFRCPKFVDKPILSLLATWTVLYMPMVGFVTQYSVTKIPSLSHRVMKVRFRILVMVYDL